MAAITAALVKELREMTGAGMMECKKALVETDGDLEGAVEALRKRGLANAAKKAGRIAAEGLVTVKVAEDGKSAAMTEVNSETDFVAKNELFQNYVANVTAQALASDAKDMDAFLAEPWIEDASVTVKDALIQKISVIGENLQIRRFEKVVTDGYVGSYIHGGGRIGVLVEMECGEVNDAVKEATKNVAMQVAAMNPKFLCREEIPGDYLAKEKEILMEQASKENKPLNILEKMVEGRIAKEMKEICLVDQLYFKDDELSVGKYVAKVSKEIGAPLSIKRYIRFETGEGIAKKEENFAEEVAKQMQK
jgi:elongation factor Ts